MREEELKQSQRNATVARERQEVPEGKYTAREKMLRQVRSALPARRKQVKQLWCLRPAEPNRSSTNGGRGRASSKCQMPSGPLPVEGQEYEEGSEKFPRQGKDAVCPLKFMEKLIRRNS